MSCIKEDKKNDIIHFLKYYDVIISNELITI